MSVAGSYQVGILGRPDGRDNILAATLHKQLAELGVDPTALAILSESQIAARERKKPFIGVFFGYRDASDTDHAILSDLISDSVVLIPAVEDLTSFTQYIPEILRHINGLELAPVDPELQRLATLMLENFRLLRSDRRLFISYRRLESQRIAIQLYEKLDALGFDVFLDTRSVPPAKDFQGILWHRLADSDLVVLLDTPGFRQSRWTRDELARANATSIQILHVLWPQSLADDQSAFSEFHALKIADFAGTDQVGANALLGTATVDVIGVMAEALRARALSARHRYLVDNFCDQAQGLGHVASVQSNRWIALHLSNGENVAVVPAIGIPNATRYQEIERAIFASGMAVTQIWLLYDERGILESWLDHIDWLNKHLPLSAVRVSDSAARMRREGT